MITQQNFLGGSKYYTMSTDTQILPVSRSAVLTASAGLNAILPPATQYSPGGPIIRLINVGPNSIGIKDNSGTLLFSLAAATSALMLLIDASTAAGRWRQIVNSINTPRTVHYASRATIAPVTPPTPLILDCSLPLYKLTPCLNEIDAYGYYTGSVNHSAPPAKYTMNDLSLYVGQIVQIATQTASKVIYKNYSVSQIPLSSLGSNPLVDVKIQGLHASCPTWFLFTNVGSILINGGPLQTFTDGISTEFGDYNYRIIRVHCNCFVLTTSKIVVRGGGSSGRVLMVQTIGDSAKFFKIFPSDDPLFVEFHYGADPFNWGLETDITTVDQDL